MTDTEAAESAVRGLAREMGLPTVPVEQAVELATFLVAKLGGKSWAEAVSAGQAAATRIKDEANAEQSRRERTGRP